MNTLLKFQCNSACIFQEKSLQANSNWIFDFLRYREYKKLTLFL